MGKDSKHKHSGGNGVSPQKKKPKTVSEYFDGNTSAEEKGACGSNMAEEQANVSMTFSCESFADIAKCFTNLNFNMESKHDEIKVVVENITRRVGELENSLQFQAKETEDLKREVLPAIKSDIGKVRDEVLALDMWGRKWNVIVFGLPQRSQELETGAVTERLVRQFFKEKLKVGDDMASRIQFQAVHRLKKKGRDGIIPIIIRFVNLNDRDTIFLHARNLSKDSGIRIVQDLPPVLVKKRAALLDERRQLPADIRRKSRLVYYKHEPFIELKY